MADVVIFHGITGLEPGGAGLEQPLRDAGHRVHCPDTYDGRRFDSAMDGYDHMESIGFDTILERATDAVSGLPPDTVLIGISMGSAVAQHLGRRRPESAGVILLHAAPGPDDDDPPWPASVPLEIHSSENDHYFTRDSADALIAEAADGRLVLYPGSGHTFADPLATEDYDPEQAPVLVANVLEFVAAKAGGPAD